MIPQRLSIINKSRKGRLFEIKILILDELFN